MIFNSLTFMLFFFIVLVVHCSPAPTIVRKVSLLTANILFFASYHPPYVLLLISSTIFNWLIANCIGKAEDTLRRLWLFCYILLNVGVLCFFKYADVSLNNFEQLLQSFGVYYQPPKAGLIAPVGISFYALQALSYAIDIYFRRIKPEPSLVNFAIFMSFFPHLVAGPVLRARDILPQCRGFHKGTPAEIDCGLNLFVWGLFQKVILADQIFAPVVNKLFAPDIQLTIIEGWSAALAFTGQIFFDFAGYSTCAIGVALCLGFKIPDNFRFPYGSLGLSDFWRRWHISLSSWLRDYLYITLGGNRNGKTRTYLNLTITMLVGGLWHDAAWHYVVWGAYHGLLLVAERLFSPVIIQIKRIGPISTIIGWFVTMYCIVISWVLFRTTTLTQAWKVIVSMHSAHENGATNIPISLALFPVIVVFLTMSLHFLLRNSTVETLFSNVPAWARSLVLGLLAFCSFTFAGATTEFIYFKF